MKPVVIAAGDVWHCKGSSATEGHLILISVDGILNLHAVDEGIGDIMQGESTPEVMASI